MTTPFKLKSGNKTSFKDMGSSPVRHTNEFDRGEDGLPDLDTLRPATHPGPDGHMPKDHKSYEHKPEEFVDDGPEGGTTEKPVVVKKPVGKTKAKSKTRLKTTKTTEKPGVEKTKETTYISSDNPKYIGKGFANYIIRKGGTVKTVNALAKRNNQRPVYNEDGTFIEYDD